MESKHKERQRRDDGQESRSLELTEDRPNFHLWRPDLVGEDGASYRDDPTGVRALSEPDE